MWCSAFCQNGLNLKRKKNTQNEFHSTAVTNCSENDSNLKSSICKMLLYVVAFGLWVLRQGQNGGCKAYCFQNKSWGKFLHPATWKNSNFLRLLCSHASVWQNRENMKCFSSGSRAEGPKIKTNLTQSTCINLQSCVG